MIVDFKLNIGDSVFYVMIKNMEKVAYVQMGIIEGFSVHNPKLGEDLELRADFRGYNGVSLKCVSIDRDKIQRKVDEFNAKCSEIMLVKVGLQRIGYVSYDDDTLKAMNDCSKKFSEAFKNLAK